MGRMRRVGLVLVDERGRGVDRPHVVGRAHEPSAPGETVARVSTMKLVWLPGNIQRIVGLQRDEHGAAAALVDEVEAVIEELAEQREPGIERGRQAVVRRDVGDLDVVAVHRDAEGLEARIADRARDRQIVDAWYRAPPSPRPGRRGRLFSRGSAAVFWSPSLSAFAAVLAFCITTRA